MPVHERLSDQHGRLIAGLDTQDACLAYLRSCGGHRICLPSVRDSASSAGRVMWHEQMRLSAYLCRGRREVALAVFADS